MWRKYNSQYETFYFSEEERGILASALRELQNNPYINEETFEQSMKLLTYLCECTEPEEQDE